MLNVVNLRFFFHLIGGKCINGRKLEPFGEFAQILPNNVLADLVFSKEQTKKLPPKIKQKN